MVNVHVTPLPKILAQQSMFSCLLVWSITLLINKHRFHNNSNAQCNTNLIEYAKINQNSLHYVFIYIYSGGSMISRRGASTSGGGRRLLRQLRFENFVCQNERIWTLRGEGRRACPLDPPMIYAIVQHCTLNTMLLTLLTYYCTCSCLIRNSQNIGLQFLARGLSISHEIRMKSGGFQVKSTQTL